MSTNYLGLSYCLQPNVLFGFSIGHSRSDVDLTLKADAFLTELEAYRTTCR